MTLCDKSSLLGNDEVFWGFFVCFLLRDVDYSDYSDIVVDVLLLFKLGFHSDIY